MGFDFHKPILSKITKNHRFLIHLNAVHPGEKISKLIPQRGKTVSTKPSIGHV